VKPLSSKFERHIYLIGYGPFNHSVFLRVHDRLDGDVSFEVCSLGILHKFS
jgi:hypothetical protein